MKTNKIRVIGAGPAALGILVAADRAGVLPKLLESGIKFYDEAETLTDISQRGLAYDIFSNSHGKEFLSGIRRTRLFRKVLEKENARIVMRHGDAPVPLRLVSAVMDDLRIHAMELMSHYANSSQNLGKKVITVKVYDGGGFELFDSANQSVGRSESLILALGAEQIPSRSHFLTADDVLRGSHYSQLETAVRHENRRKIVILGGSHSAFSVANYLLEQFRGSLNAAQVVIIHRSAIRLFFHSVEDARASGYPFDSIMDVCPNTRQVNRFSGLRYHAKKLYLDIINGGESRVKLIEGDGSATSENQFGEKPIFIQATGYSARKIDIIDEAMRPMDIDVSQGDLVVGDQGAVLARDGRPINGLFAI